MLPDNETTFTTTLRENTTESQYGTGTAAEQQWTKDRDGFQDGALLIAFLRDILAFDGRRLWFDRRACHDYWDVAADVGRQSKECSDRGTTAVEVDEG